MITAISLNHPSLTKFQVLKFEFLDLEIEETEDCSYDYVAFYSLSQSHRQQFLVKTKHCNIK